MFTSDEEEITGIGDDSETEEVLMANMSEDTKLITSVGKSTAKINTNESTLHLDSDDSQSTENFHGSSGIQSHDKNGENSPPRSTLYVWLLSSFAAIGGFLFGYDTGVVSGAMLLLRDKFSLSSFWQELIVSVTIGAAFLSALIGGNLNDTFGRKVVTIIASFIFTAGALVLGFAQNVTMLVVGRLILGLGIGLASMTVPVYIAESSPPHLRGRLVTVNNMFITGGQFVASLMDGGFSYVKPDGWRYMLGLAGIPSLIQFCGFFFLPESPRWLMRKGRESEVRAVLVKLRGTHLIDEEFNELKQTLQSESNHKDFFTFGRILRTPPVRRAVIVGCGLQLIQQLSGINTVMYYSATIIKMSGVSDQHLAIWLAAMTAGINFSFTLVGLWLVERIGRKKLMMGSLFGVTLSLILLAVAFQLAAFHSPPVLDRDLAQLNSSCSHYRWCEDCIENTDCGFCYTGSGSSANGSCVAADSKESSHAKYGSCENTTLPAGYTWAYEYCPTSYSWMAILGLVLYLMFFAPGMGPMPWTINSEIYPIWARSTGNSLSAATNWISNLVVSMTFLTLTQVLTKYGTYWLFVGITILGLVFIGVYLPETKGHKLEEIDQLFSQPWCTCCSSPQRSHSQYQTLPEEQSS